MPVPEEGGAGNFGVCRVPELDAVPVFGDGGVGDGYLHLTLKQYPMGADLCIGRGISFLRPGDRQSL